MSAIEHAFHLRKGNAEPEMVEIDLPQQVTYRKVAIRRPASKTAPADRNRKKEDNG